MVETFRIDPQMALEPRQSRRGRPRGLIDLNRDDETAIGLIQAGVVRSGLISLHPLRGILDGKMDPAGLR